MDVPPEVLKEHIAETMALARQKGDAAYEAGQGRVASVAYLTGLNMLDGAADNLLTDLLENSAVTHLMLLRPAHALMHAAAVLVFLSSRARPAKACALAARAAAAMGDTATARHLISHVPKSAATAPTARLAAALQAQLRTDSSLDPCSWGPLIESPALARAMVHASLQLPDTPPGANFFTAASPSQGAGDASAGDPTSPSPSPHLPASAAIDIALRMPDDRIGPAEIERATELKQEGNRMLKAGEFQGALAKWAEAIAMLREVPHFVHRAALATLHVDHGPAATVVAVAGLLWAPDSRLLLMARSAHASALSCCPDSVERDAVAHACAEQALRILPESPELRQQYKQLAGPMRTHSQQAAQQLKEAGVSAAKQRHEAEMAGAGDGKAEVVRKEMLLARMRQNSRQTAVIERCIGPMPESFEKSYFKEGLLLDGCSGKACFGHLALGAKDAFWQWAKLVTWAIERQGKGGAEGGATWAQDPLGGADNSGMMPGQLVVRLEGGAPEAQAWWQHAAIGSVSFAPKAFFLERFDKLFSFSNVQQHALPLWSAAACTGTACGSAAGGKGPEGASAAGDDGMHVHVAVAFVDLGAVAETLAAEEEQGQMRRLRWVGYQGSAHACARVMVIIRMLQYEAPVDSIVQVWYSAVWAPSTVPHFRTAVAKLLKSQKSLGYSQSVRKWLEAWRDAKVPLKKARREWLKRQVNTCSFLSTGCDRSDCHTLCSYRLTGQLLEGTAGSVTMFALLETQEKFLDYTNDESLLNTITPGRLMGEYRGVKAAGGPCTLVAAGVATARRRVRALQAAVTAGLLVAEVRHEEVNHRTAAALASIRALAPDSMAWGNLCDYMQPPAFHHLARAASLPHTRHFMHSLNWILRVKGAFLMDHSEWPRSRAATVAKRAQLTALGYAAVARAVRELGGEGVLRSVPLENDMNVAEAVLHQYMCRRWLDAFAGLARQGSVVAYKVLREPRYWFFSRCNSVVQFEIKYS